MKTKDHTKITSLVAFVKCQLHQLREGGLSAFKSKGLTATRIFLSSANYVWALPVLLIVRVIRPLILIRFYLLNNARIGHIAIDASFFLAIQPKQSGLPIILHWFANAGLSCNQQWSKMIERKLYVRSWVKYLVVLNKIIPGGKPHVVPALTGSRATDGIFQKKIERFEFSPQENQIALDWLQKRGWNSGESIVCLLVRDSAYLTSNVNITDHKSPKDRWAYHNYRDTNIDSYNLLIEYLLAQGKWVVRMSKVVEKPLSIAHPRLIDYHAAPDKSDLLDVWLSINCEQFVSTSSGIDNFPIVYSKPILFVNAMPLALLYSWHPMIWTPKNLVWKSSGKSLTLREQLHHRYLTSKEYDFAGIDLVDLTSEELRDAAIEFDQRLKGTWQDSPDDIARQKLFWENFSANKDFPKYHGWIHPNARVGTHFLRRMGDDFFKDTLSV